MSEYNVSVAVLTKQAATNRCNTSCMTSELELGEIGHRPSIKRSSRPACAFIPSWITHCNKQTKKATEQILNVLFQEREKNQF